VLLASISNSNLTMHRYICDDCTGMLTRQYQTDVHGNPLTNWDTCTALAGLYDALRELDPHHVTIGAVQSSDMWSFSDATGVLSLDVRVLIRIRTF
jgi:hypothetical protein